jgi:hypothetical protein
MDAHHERDLRQSLAELELLVFGSTLEDEALVTKFLAADAGFNAYVITRLVRKAVVLH